MKRYLTLNPRPKANKGAFVQGSMSNGKKSELKDSLLQEKLDSWLNSNENTSSKR